ncbi:MAG: hypothetical protein IPF64_12665 [Flavobacteriales bacterium]|nr:hypothetical protein [Flavobacteriales bacterium]
MDTVDEYGGKGSEHFTSWNYDTHVPVIFFGQGIKPGEVVAYDRVGYRGHHQHDRGLCLTGCGRWRPCPEVLR